MDVAMGIVVLMPLMVVGAFLLGQGFTNQNPRRARIVGGSILGAIVIFDIVWLVWKFTHIPTLR